MSARGVLLPNTKGQPDQMEKPMEKEVSPVEARGGVISGRVITILAASSVGAVLALVVAWLAFGFR
jgi:hypothetical protein